MKKTAGKIVVCGGHEKFVNKLKPMLRCDVRYIHRERSFDVETLSGASVIWIQPNAIVHPSMYRIKDYAKDHGIPVMHLSYSSARKCADQIMDFARKGG